MNITQSKIYQKPSTIFCYLSSFRRAHSSINFYHCSRYKVTLIQLCQKLCEQHLYQSLTEIPIIHYQENYKDCEALMIQIQVHIDKLEGHMICINLCTFY